MDFTREPVIETVITPREGHKLVVRSSKSSSQEEYFVDAVEVVSFGGAFFFRSLEKPKSFLLPVIDYEILEVRETRMVLKHVGSEKSIKIGTGRKEKEEKKASKKEEEKPAKKRERRRQQRRRRTSKTEEHEPERVELPKPPEDLGDNESPDKSTEPASKIIRSLLSSPPPLISETINQYRETYSQAFYEREEGDEEDEDLENASNEAAEQSEEEKSFEKPPENSEPIAEGEEISLTRENSQKESYLTDLWNFSEDH